MTLGNVTSTGSLMASDAPLLVLVIDDELPIVRMLASGLARLGFATLTASSAAEAKALLNERRDIGVVVSDINMPLESGLVFAEELLGSHLEEDALEVILMTGFSRTEDAIAAVRIHVFDFLPKPFRIEQMGEVLQRAMDSAWQRRMRAANSGFIAARVAEAEAERQRLAAQLAESTARLDDVTVELVTSRHARKDLLAMVSHELRTPLIPIIGFAEMMQHAQTIPENKFREWAAMIEAGGQRLLSMIDGALEIVTLDQGIHQAERVTINLARLLRRAIEPHSKMAELNEVTIKLQAEPELFVSSDVNAMIKAVGHLLENAIKASPPGAEVEVSAWASAYSVWISVSDRGAGIPRAVLEQLGTPFLQADMSLSRGWQGLGLGLALTVRIAHAHGGRLTLLPRSGGGTSGLIELPSNA